MNVGGVEIQKRHVTLTGMVAGATLVVGSLGMLAKGVVDLESKIGVSQTERDSLYSEMRQMSRRIAKLETKVGLKKGKVIHRRDQKREGIGRRLLGILW